MVTFRFHQYQVVGKALPTENDEHPKIYRMKLWAINEVRAKSKFWYFLRKLKKVKKSNGQVLAINEIARLQSLGSDGSELKWIEGFNIGSVIEAKIGEAKDIGVVVSFDKYNDVLGFITHSQLMHLLGYIIEGCCHH